MNSIRHRRAPLRTSHTIVRGLAASLVLALAGSCVTTSASTSTTGHTKGPWLAPSPTLRSQIEDNAKRLPWKHGVDRVEMIQWFAGVGEPAYPKLLEMAIDPRSDVAGAAYAALGATRDARLVEPVRALPMPTGDDSLDLSYERARALLRLGDWQSAPTLIAGLRDDRPVTRALCFQTLAEVTHETFSFDPRGEPEPRDEAAKRWESWWKSRQQDPLLSGSKPESKPQPKKDQD